MTQRPTDQLRKKFAKLAKKDPEKGIVQAQDLLNRGHIENGLQLLEILHETQPARNDIALRLGINLLQHRRFRKAVPIWKKLIRKTPMDPSGYSNLSVALAKTDQLDAAIQALRQAIVIKPDYAFALNNLGNSLKQGTQYQEALKLYRVASISEGEYSAAEWNRGIIEMLLGNLQKGWPLLEAGWATGERVARRRTEMPLWRGEALEGRTLLIHPEQGLGDAIQIARYFKPLTQLGGRVIIEAPPQLIRLFRAMNLDCLWIEEGGQIPPYDIQCPLMSLPMVMGVTLENLPGAINYIEIEESIRAYWEQTLGPRERPRIGLVCSGSPSHWDDTNRSLPLEQFEKYLKLPAEFHCLQKELRPADAAWARENPELIAHCDVLEDFASTAGLVNAMDLIISVDTSVAHLAAAMGKTVWVLLPLVPDYRWLLGRSDSPWYPSVRLFRQITPQGWDAVLFEVFEALEKYLNSRQQP